MYSKADCDPSRLLNGNCLPTPIAAMTWSSDDDGNVASKDIDIYTPKEYQLNLTGENFASWRMHLESKLERGGLLHHLRSPKLASGSPSPIEQDEPTGLGGDNASVSGSDPRASGNRRNGRRGRTRGDKQIEHDRKVALIIIHQSLSVSLRHTIPKSLYDLENLSVTGDPKALYDHIIQKHGQLDVSSQSLLWRELFTHPIAEEEDPQPRVDRINEILSILRTSYAQAPGPPKTVDEVLEDVAGFAILESLPRSYDAFRWRHLLGGEKKMTLGVSPFRLAEDVKGIYRLREATRKGRSREEASAGGTNGGEGTGRGSVKGASTGTGTRAEGGKGKSRQRGKQRWGPDGKRMRGGERDQYCVTCACHGHGSQACFRL